MRKELQALNLLLCFSMRPGSRVPGEQGGRSGSLQARAAGRLAQTSRFVLQGSSLEVCFSASLISTQEGQSFQIYVSITEQCLPLLRERRGEDQSL